MGCGCEEPDQVVFVAAVFFEKCEGLWTRKAVEAKTKNAWAKELMLVVSFSGWGLHIITATVSSYSKYATMINKAAPYNYPVPV